MPRKYIYVTAVAIEKGIITLVEPNGCINFYAQRGISKLTQEQFKKCIAEGKLDCRIKSLPELPSNYCIRFEDEQIMGKARATFKP